MNKDEKENRQTRIQRSKGVDGQMRPQAKRPESTMKFWTLRNNRVLIWKETSADIPLRNHLRRVLLVALVHLVPSKRAAEVSKISRGAAYRSQ